MTGGAEVEQLAQVCTDACLTHREDERLQPQTERFKLELIAILGCRVFDSNGDVYIEVGKGGGFCKGDCTYTHTCTVSAQIYRDIIRLIQLHFSDHPGQLDSRT